MFRTVIETLVPSLKRITAGRASKIDYCLVAVIGCTPFIAMILGIWAFLR